MLHETYFQIINIYSISGQDQGFRVTETPAIPIVVRIGSEKVLRSVRVHTVTVTFNSIKTFDFFTFYTTGPTLI